MNTGKKYQKPQSEKAVLQPRFETYTS